MKNILVIICLFLYGCGKQSTPTTPAPSVQEKQGQENNQNANEKINCLKEKISLDLSTKQDLSEVAEKVGDASIECDASSEEIKTFIQGKQK